MFPWGALIGLAGQAVSGVASAINNKRTQQAADAEAARQSAYYNAKASENPLSRSENQHLLGQYDRDAQKQVEQARNVAAIKGMTPEYSLGVQKAVAEGRADLMGNMSVNASGRADYYKQKGEEAAHQKFLDDQGRKAARNMTYANLAANAASAAGAIMDSYTAAGTPSAEPEEEQLPTIHLPGVSSKEQQKIDTTLAAVGNQVRADRGHFVNPGINPNPGNMYYTDPFTGKIYDKATLYGDTPRKVVYSSNKKTTYK